MIKTIALTGGIGSGKSTVATLLAKRGYTVWDADVFSREVLFFPDVEEKIKTLFGSSIFLSPGTLDRKLVREKIFENLELRKVFEEIIHPSIYKLYLEKLALVQKVTSSAWIFYEASLILELNKKSHFDACVVVTADDNTKFQRLQENRELGKNEVQKMMLAQMPDVQKIPLADFVLDNSSNLETLEHALDELLLFLRHKFSV